MKKLIVSVIVIVGILCLYTYLKSRDQTVNTTDKNTETGVGVGTSIKAKAGVPVDSLEWKNSRHLTFRGVPIDGTLKCFVARMEAVGFECVEKEEGVACLQGDFAAFKDCWVYVQTIDGKDLVSTILVTFPEQDQWKNLSGDYAYLKELLTEKYGKPVSCVERFQTLSFAPKPDDRDKMYLLKDGNCQYTTRYDTEKGQLVLSIEYGERMRYSQGACFVMLSYLDKINNKVMREYAKGDL